eukprot:Nitzschia sp. Nitz4//scaffold181_size46380//4021//6696//NITZ4_007169-RA/size46380-processed-gene-0.19-mRNA-1//1//CDS//3329539486//4621//frame0
MEILIPVPSWAAAYLETLFAWASTFYVAGTQSWTYLSELASHQRSAVLLIPSLVIFWPLWVYFAVAVTTASTWIFWLLTSVVLGMLQVVYVTYQFIMIACDVVVLTALKTYQVLMRSRLAQSLFFFSKRIRQSHLRTSQRRKWRADCEEAHSYGDFLRIPVLEPKQPDPIDGALAKTPPRKFRRCRSMGNMVGKNQQPQGLETLLEEESPTKESRHSMPASPLNRTLSFEAIKSFDDDLDNDVDPSLAADLGTLTSDVLLTTTQRLKEARKAFNEEGSSSLSFLLSGVVKRNHLTVEDLLVNNARSVASTGQHAFSAASRKAIANYYDAVSKGLDSLAEAPVSAKANSTSYVSELKDRVTLVRKMKQNMGRTALMLSGGGAQAMYHLGTIRALVDSELYDDIHVISGTSGGSITAACCAMFRSDELYEDICIPTVSTDYRLNGEMKRRNIRWFPPIMDMGTYWLKHRLLVDSQYFFQTCEFYYGNTTFEEAFEKTGKHVCITVSASRASGGTAQRLLLNHISTPHVTLASAVAASCALPGVMKPAKLQAKNSAGEIEPFEVDGVEWIDGSVQADLPFQRISTLFNVSNYIVCQTNFHVVPFLNKDYHPNNRSKYWKLFQTIEWDIRNRCLKLSKLGLFPRIFGQDISKVFKQKYHGNLTLVPRFTTAQTFGLKALVNPTKKEMEGYLKYGQMAAWPYLGVIRDMIRLEKALDECLERLKSRFADSDVFDGDELDSIASSSVGPASLTTTRVVRFTVQEQQVERLKSELSRVEQENQALREQLAMLQSNPSNQGETFMVEEKKGDDLIGIRRRVPFQTTSGQAHAKHLS